VASLRTRCPQSLLLTRAGTAAAAVADVLDVTLLPGDGAAPGNATLELLMRVVEEPHIVAEHDPGHPLQVGVQLPALMLCSLLTLLCTVTARKQTGCVASHVVTTIIIIITLERQLARCDSHIPTCLCSHAHDHQQFQLLSTRDMQPITYVLTSACWCPYL
jgi:hypothetical protein